LRVLAAARHGRGCIRDVAPVACRSLHVAARPCRLLHPDIEPAATRCGAKRVACCAASVAHAATQLLALLHVASYNQPCALRCCIDSCRRAAKSGLFLNALRRSIGSFALRCVALRCAATMVARLSRRVRVDLHDRSLATHPAAAHTRTHARTHARTLTHTHTHARTHTHTHAHTHTHTRTHAHTAHARTNARCARTDTAVRCHRCRTCGGCARRRRGFYSGSGPPARKQQRCGRCELSSE
jgi:hypothetical protein